MNIQVVNDPSAPSKLFDTRGRRNTYIIRNSSGTDFWIAEHRSFLQGSDPAAVVAQGGFLIGAADTQPTYLRNFKGEVYALAIGVGAVASIFQWDENEQCECGS